MSTLLSLPLLDLHMDSWAYTPNGTQLLVDGDMEAVGTAAWTGIGAGVVLTKETGTPHSGTQCLRVASTLPAVALARPAVGVTTIGRRYRVYGWARGDGVRLPTVMDYDIAILWTGTGSTTWQYFDVTYTAASTVGPCFWQSAGAVGYAEFDDITLELCPASTRNIGSLGGVALVGNGVTTSTFPTQLAPHGMSYDGGTDIIQVTSTMPGFSSLSFGNGAGTDYPFSLEALVKPNPAGALIPSLFGKVGEYFLAYSTMGITGAISTAAWGSVIGRTAAYVNTGMGALTHIAFTYDGSRAFSGFMIYANGVRVDSSNYGWGPAYTFMTPSANAMIIGWANGVGNYFSGAMYNAAIYPWALTPSQVAQKYRERMGLLNVY